MAISAAYNAAVALDLIPIGELPGDSSPGEAVLAWPAFLGWLAGVIVSFASIRCPEQIGLMTRRLLPLAYAAALVAAYYSYDSYCAPSRCRISEYSDLPASVILACVLAALVTAALAGVVPRVAITMTACCTVTFAIIGFLTGPWH